MDKKDPEGMQRIKQQDQNSNRFSLLEIRLIFEFFLIYFYSVAKQFKIFEKIVIGSQKVFIAGVCFRDYLLNNTCFFLICKIFL